MKSPRAVRLVALGIVFGAAFMVGRRSAPDPTPGPPVVQTDTVYAEHERPDLVKPSLGEKLATARVTPTQTRIASAPSAAGREAVAIYCRPAIALQTSANPAPDSLTDTTAVKESLPPALLPDFQGRIRGSRVTLYSTLNDGRRWAADYRPRGHWSFETDGDSVVMRSDRLWVRVTRGAWKCAPAIGGSGAIGALTTEQPLRGALLGSAAAALGCLF